MQLVDLACLGAIVAFPSSHTVAYSDNAMRPADGSSQMPRALSASTLANQRAASPFVLKVYGALTMRPSMPRYHACQRPLRSRRTFPQIDAFRSRPTSAVARARVLAPYRLVLPRPLPCRPGIVGAHRIQGSSRPADGYSEAGLSRVHRTTGVLTVSTSSMEGGVVGSLEGATAALLETDLHPSASEPPDFFTVEEAARVLRIGRTAAYALTRTWRDTDGRDGLPVVPVGRLLRVPRAALRADGRRADRGACPRRGPAAARVGTTGRGIRRAPTFPARPTTDTAARSTSSDQPTLPLT